jgi:Flp pilus assembly protein TadG
VIGRRRCDRGSAAVEMAVLMPVFVALFTAVIVIGRTSSAVSAVEMAAYEGARTASLARDADSARIAAAGAVTESLSRQGNTCRGGPEIEVDTTGFGRPVGTPASVAVRVTCQVSFGDLGGALPGRVVSASFVSPLDQFRVRR